MINPVWAVSAILGIGSAYKEGIYHMYVVYSQNKPYAKSQYAIVGVVIVYIEVGLHSDNAVQPVWKGQTQMRIRLSLNLALELLA